MHKHKRSVFVLGAILAMVLAVPAGAEPGGGASSLDPTDLYTSPNLNSGFAIPSGGINPGPAVGEKSNSVYNPGLTAKPVDVPKDTQNILGCGGVGQNEYTSGLYNMPETFGKFQQDVNSLFAKQILAMNYIMPQTAALFDQLNNFGDQRYQIFQKGCNLDAMRQSAKDQYLQKCVSELKDKRKTELQKLYPGAGGGNQGGDLRPKEPLLTSMAYAQAWEICTNQYVSNTTAFAMRKEMNEKFAEQVRRVENVTAAIMPLLCPFEADNANDLAEGCWPELLVPQVRICLEGSFGCDNEEGAYTVREPYVSMQRLFDTMRYILDDTVVARRINKYTSELDKLSGSTLTQSAKDASLNMGYATLFRMDTGAAGGGSPKFSPPGQMQPVDKSILDFQSGYLNCKNPDIMAPLKALNTAITKRLPTGTTAPVLPALVMSDYQEVIAKMEVEDADGNKLLTSTDNAPRRAFTNLTWAALGCSANQTVPLFDPNIVASLNTRCLPQDRYAFYTMASYDTAAAATRDVYRYLNNRLKQAHTRLLIDSRVPYGGAKLAVNIGDDNADPTINPELNKRLATVVKEVMIPYVESQLARLDDVDKSRGDFARRVQQIYSDKSGCVYGDRNAVPAGPGAPPRPPTR